MNVVFISKSDLRGGAAIVTFRLCEALRRTGVDARMLVVERLSDKPWVVKAASDRKARIPFLSERLQIFMANGYDRRNLFKADTASAGLPLWHHPLVKAADVVVLGWWNQGVLSLHGVRRIASMGKPIVQVMHDMWSMTGICHHAGSCHYYEGSCGNCPLLGKKRGASDLSHIVWKHKEAIVRDVRIRFVAVSRWLAARGRQSGLLRGADLRVIPNLSDVAEGDPAPKNSAGPFRIAFGAARLDDDIKGLPILLEALDILAREHPQLAARCELNTFGGLKNQSALDHVAIPHRYHGVVPADKVRNLLAECHIVLSTSLYETLPGTLIEGQIEGCWPVAFDRGGQSDIITPGATGSLVSFGTDEGTAARNMADALASAIQGVAEADSRRLGAALRESVRKNFSEHGVVRQWLRLFDELTFG